MNIDKVCAVSVDHITGEDWRALHCMVERKDRYLWLQPDDGFMLVILEDKEEMIKTYSGFSPYFFHLVDLARSQNAVYLCLCPESDPEPDCPTWDWDTGLRTDK